MKSESQKSDNFLMPSPINQKNIIPKYLTIKNHQYVFKERLPDNKLVYKCKIDTCPGTLNIDKTKLEKFTLNITQSQNESESSNIVVNIVQEHNCNIVNIISVTEGIETMLDKPSEIQENNNCVVEKDVLDRAKKKILREIDKSIRWHMKNLLDLNLAIPYEELKNIRITEREKKYPYDNQFLFNIWIIYLLIWITTTKI